MHILAKPENRSGFALLVPPAARCPEKVDPDELSGSVTAELTRTAQSSVPRKKTESGYMILFDALDGV